MFIALLYLEESMPIMLHENRWSVVAVDFPLGRGEVRRPTALPPLTRDLVMLGQCS